MDNSENINRKTASRLLKKQLKNASSDGRPYTHVCICKGAYKIDRKKFKTLKLYESLAEDRVPSICERFSKKFPLFFDVDGISDDLDIFKLHEIIFNILKKCFIVDDDCSEYYISQNKSKSNSYHVYYPKIIVNKDMCLIISDIINRSEETKDVIDTLPFKTGGLRMLGVLKWNKEKSDFDDNSYHELIRGSNEEILESSLAEQMMYLSVIIPQKHKLTKTSAYYSDKKSSLAKTFVDSKYPKRDSSYFKKNIHTVKTVRDIVHKILFECLDESRLDTKKKWSSVIFCIKNIENSYDIKVKDIALEWSKKSKHYKSDSDWLDKEIASIWNLKKIKDYGLEKLYKLAKKDNPDKYYNLLNGVNKWEKHIDSISIEYIRFCYNRFDLGDAELFSRLYNRPEQRIVCSSTKKGFEFYYWNGEIWKLDQGGYMRTLICSQLSGLYQRYINDLQDKINQIDDDDANDKEKYIEIKKEVIKRAQKCYTKKHSDNLIPLIASELFDCNFKSKLNSNKDIISCSNGVVELDNNGNLRSHRIDDYCTYKLDVYFPKEGIKVDTSEIDSFFNDIMLDDKDMVKYLQRFLGYSITGHTIEQKFVVFWGELGGNGKSVLIELLRHVMEENKYYATLSGDSLLKNRKSSPGSATPHLLPLFGSRLAILDESDKAVKLNEGMIKRITGNKTCTVRPLFKEEFTFENCSQPILITNFRPNISNDSALHRRLILIPFEAEFKDRDDFDENDPKHRKKDSKKFEKLIKSSEELLIWLIKGAIDWYDNGLEEFPDKIRDATERYKLESDELYNFLHDEDICELPPLDEEFDRKDYFTTTQELLDKYVSETNNRCNKKEFRDMLLKHGHKEIKYKSKKGYKIKLIFECLLDED